MYIVHDHYMYILSIKHAPVRLSNGADVLTMSKISPKDCLNQKDQFATLAIM